MVSRDLVMIFLVSFKVRRVLILFMDLVFSSLKTKSSLMISQLRLFILCFFFTTCLSLSLSLSLYVAVLHCLFIDCCYSEVLKNNLNSEDKRKCWRVLVQIIKLTGNESVPLSQIFLWIASLKVVLPSLQTVSQALLTYIVLFRSCSLDFPPL